MRLLAPLPLQQQSLPRDLSLGNTPLAKPAASPQDTWVEPRIPGKFLQFCRTLWLLSGVCRWKKQAQLGPGSPTVWGWVWRCSLS